MSSTIKQNGSEIIQTKDKIRVNGKTYDIPKHVQSNSNTLERRNGKMIINGYLFDETTGKFSAMSNTTKTVLVLAAVVIGVSIGWFVLGPLVYR